MKYLLKLATNSILILAFILVIAISLANEARTSDPGYCKGFQQELAGREFLVESIGFDQGEKYKLTLKDIASQRKFLAKLPQNNNLVAGDHVLVNGKMKIFDKTDTFSASYVTYIRRKGICGNVIIHEDNLRITEGSNVIQRLVSPLKQNMVSNIQSNFSQDTSGLMIAVIFGDTFLFSDDLEQSFRQIGITHLVAVSGANFILVVSIFSQFLRILKVRLQLAATLTIATIYMLLVGLDNLPAFRAYLFFMLAVFQKFTGRRLSKLTIASLCIIIIMLLKQGAYADMGLQLSFIAWASLNLFLKSLTKKFAFLPSLLRDEILVAALGTLILLPVSLLYFEEINLLSVVYNAFLVPIFGILNIVFLFALVLIMIFSRVPVQIVDLLNALVALLLNSIESASQYTIKVALDSYAGLALVAFFAIFVITNIWKQISNESKISPMAKYAC
jgi:competence protein ComEC